MPITTTNMDELLYPGLRVIWGLSYKDYAPEWSQIFPVKKSTQAYEKTLGMTGFGLAATKDYAFGAIGTVVGARSRIGVGSGEDAPLWAVQAMTDIAITSRTNIVLFFTVESPLLF